MIDGSERDIAIMKNRKLGSGAFGVVYYARDIEDSSKEYAVKIISAKNLSDEKQQFNLLKEQYILESVQSKLMIGYHGAAETPNGDKLLLL